MAEHYNAQPVEVGDVIYVAAAEHHHAELVRSELDAEAALERARRNHERARRNRERAAALLADLKEDA